MWRPYQMQSIQLLFHEESFRAKNGEKCDFCISFYGNCGIHDQCRGYVGCATNYPHCWRREGRIFGRRRAVLLSRGEPKLSKFNWRECLDYMILFQSKLQSFFQFKLYFGTLDVDLGDGSSELILEQIASRLNMPISFVPLCSRYHRKCLYNVWTQKGGGWL